VHLQRAYQCGRGTGVGSGSHCGVEFGRRCHAVPKWVYSSGRLFFVSVRTNKRHHHHHHHHHHPVHVSAQKNPSTGGIGETQAPTQREREGGCEERKERDQRVRGEERERSTRHQVNNLQQCGVAVGNARHAAIFSFLLVQIFALFARGLAPHHHRETLDLEIDLFGSKRDLLPTAHWLRITIERSFIDNQEVPEEREREREREREEREREKFY